MKRTMTILALAAVAASPLAAQHDHPAAPAPRPARAPAAATPAPRATVSHGMNGTTMAGMDSMMGTHSRMMGAGMDSMMAPLHALMAYAPRGLLERRAALRLDEDQASRLARLAALSQPVQDSAMMASHHHWQALQQALAIGGDPAVAASHFDAMHAAMGAAHAAGLRAALEARALLTAGQRSLAEAAQPHH